MAQERKRIQFKFWLDILKDNEWELAEAATQLIKKRSFSRTIRDGLRLILDLRAGNTYVLFELFPWLKSELTQPAVVASESQLQQEIAQLRVLILGQGDGLRPMLNDMSGPKPLAAPKIAMPTFDDDDQDTIIIRRDLDADGEVGNNFLNAALGLLG